MLSELADRLSSYCTSTDNFLGRARRCAAVVVPTYIVIKFISSGFYSASLCVSSTHLRNLIKKFFVDESSETAFRITLGNSTHF